MTLSIMYPGSGSSYLCIYTLATLLLVQFAVQELNFSIFIVKKFVNSMCLLSQLHVHVPHSIASYTIYYI